MNLRKCQFWGAWKLHDIRCYWPNPIVHTEYQMTPLNYDRSRHMQNRICSASIYFSQARFHQEHKFSSAIHQQLFCFYVQVEMLYKLQKTTIISTKNTSLCTFLIHNEALLTKQLHSFTIYLYNISTCKYKQIIPDEL